MQKTRQTSDCHGAGKRRKPRQFSGERAKHFDELGEKSPASYAIRFAAGFEGIDMVLSGMSSYEQMADNISYIKEFQPLNNEEMEAVRKV